MTIDEIKEMRDAAQTAYLNALKAQSMSMNNRTLTNQNIKDLKDQFDYWDRRHKKAEDGANGGGKQYSLVRFRSE